MGMLAHYLMISATPVVVIAAAVVMTMADRPAKDAFLRVRK